MRLINMVFQSLPSIALFGAIMTIVCEGRGEMLGLNVVPHMVPGCVIKLITNSAAITALAVIFGNVLHHIIWGHWT